ncbi:hypothetical protein AT6N2_C0473 [Agrobacterium tumefaciens]|nr:hypothetical protein AT6N2_C0473 [Agrobacterium tumefaciens]
MRKLALCFGRYEDHRPCARGRELDEADLLERVRVLLQNGFEQLLDAFIDRPHQRHAVEDGFADADDPFADQIISEEADEGNADDGDQQAKAGNGDIEILLGIVTGGDVGLHPAVGPLQEAPHQPHGDGDGRENQNARKEAVAQPCRKGNFGRNVGHLPFALSAVAIETRMKTDNAGWRSPMQAKNCEIFVRNPKSAKAFDGAKTEASIIIGIASNDTSRRAQPIERTKPLTHQP